LVTVTAGSIGSLVGIGNVAASTARDQVMAAQAAVIHDLSAMTLRASVGSYASLEDAKDDVV